MQKYLIVTLCALFTGCINKHDKNSHYSKEQISSLHLDSTKVLEVTTDSLVRIDLNPFLHKQSFDFGSLVEEIKLIPLESTDASLLDDIYKIFITESNIYIMDGLKGRGIAIFGKNGKFIKRIPQGQGPGELFRLYDIAFDNVNNELIAYNHSNLIFFSHNGEFIRQTRLPFGFYNFTVIPDGYIFKTLDRLGNEHLGQLANYTLLVTDKHFKIKQAGMPRLPLNDVLIEYDYLYNNNQQISVTQPYIDTLYKYENGTEYLKTEFVLDYEERKLPDQYLHCSSFDEFDKVIRNNNYYFYNGRYLSTKTHNIFFLENYSSGRTVIYRDKQSKNLIGGTNADYNMNEIPPIAFPISSTDSWFISVYLPNEDTRRLSNSSIISAEDKREVNNLTEDSNPILVFFRLKEF